MRRRRNNRRSRRTRITESDIRGMIREELSMLNERVKPLGSNATTGQYVSDFDDREEVREVEIAYGASVLNEMMKVIEREFGDVRYSKVKQTRPYNPFLGVSDENVDTLQQQFSVNGVKFTVKYTRTYGKLPIVDIFQNGKIVGQGLSPEAYDQTPREFLQYWVNDYTSFVDTIDELV